MHPRFLLLAALALTGCSHSARVTHEPVAANPSVAVDPSKPNSPANTPDAVATNNIIAQIASWRLGPLDIQNDLDGGVTIVRSHPDGAGTPTGRVDDHQLVAAVKQRLEADDEIGHAPIDVTAKQGVVALKGQAPTAATIGRAIAVALGTPGVSRVTSDIKPQQIVAPAETRR